MSEKKTLYPQQLSQTSETNTSYRQFTGLSNLKNGSNTYARTGQIASSTGTHKRPSTITATKFTANLPTGATITKITCEYEAAYEGNIHIAAPTLDLLNVKAAAKKGKSLTKSMVKTTVTWTGTHIISNVNNNSFGVKIDWPANTKSDVGYVKVKYIRLIIEYTLPDYSVSASHLDSDKYTDDVHRVNFSITNKNKTAADSAVTITLPSGITYLGKDSGTGSIDFVGSTLTWTPKVSGKSSSSIVLSFLVTSNGNHTIKLKETVTGHTASLNVKTTVKPSYDGDEDEDADSSININDGVNTPSARIVANEPYPVNIIFGDDAPANVTLRFEVTNDVEENVFYRKQGTDTWYCLEDISTYYVSTSKPIPTEFKVNRYCQFTLTVSWEGTNEDVHIISSVLLNVVPSPGSLSTPSLTAVQIKGEELARLGDGEVYTLQSYLKLVTTYETYVRDWYKNYRIGVFNNINPNVDQTIITYDDEGNPVIADPTDYSRLDLEDIFNYAAYWSQPLHSPNTYESVTVEFPYDEDYPLWVLITGDYPQSVYQDLNTLKYTEPCIIEADTFDGWENHTNLPRAINSLKTGESAFSSITLNSFETSKGVIFYKLPLQDVLTGDEVVKGIQIDFDIGSTDPLSMNCQLRSPNGELGERSMIINSTDTNITIGGRNDKWGFNSTDFTELALWEIRITLSNNYNTGNAKINFNNCVVTIYYDTYEDTVVQCFVDGENLNAYGFFLTDLSIPAGLETDTKFLNVDGTDLNDIYRQNIKEKTIDISFEIDGCDIEESTELLRELIQLLVNERTELNKPIPKRIEFTNYPDVYWEYVMEGAVTYDVNIASYSCKLKLTIPAGTAFTKEETSTGKTGRVNGIAKVNPVIAIIPLDEHIEITEENSSQTFSMTYNTWNTNNTVIIDCANRTVTLQDTNDETDITAYTDYNSDWFILSKEFTFNETNCVIQSVTWTERM